MIFEEDIEQLVSTALGYSQHQMVSEVFGETHDTFEPDLKLFTIVSGREINEKLRSKITEAGKSIIMSRQSLQKNKPIILEKERQLDQLKQSKPDLP